MTIHQTSSHTASTSYQSRRGGFKLDDQCKFLKRGVCAFKYSVKLRKNEVFLLCLSNSLRSTEA